MGEGKRQKRVSRMGYSRKKLELTGERYGYLKVLGAAENIGKRTAWRCQCACGKEVVVPTHRLRCGHTRSCGCQCGSGEPRIALGLTYVEGTCVELLRAKRVRRNNTSGVTGVEWWTSKGRWRASISFKGKRHYLGSYSSFEEAVQARKQAEEALHDQFLWEFAGEGR